MENSKIVFNYSSKGAFWIFKEKQHGGIVNTLFEQQGIVYARH
jgi:hypothetical protein